jgi:eukaryotic-like serine/threonine-protein kinase
MPTNPARVQELFLAALDLPDEAARAAYLDAACGDAELRARVETLLRAHDTPDSLLDAPVVPTPGGDAPTRTLTPADPGGTVTHSPEGAAPVGAGPEFGFELGEEVGRGAMGVVYRARQRGLNRVVAVKMALGLERAARHALARFLAEAEAVAAIDHPHVVRVYGFGHRDGVPYLAMEYLPGGTLADRLRSGPLVPRAAAELMAKVASGVAAVHAQGIVHRDLKPGNVLLDETGEPKVTDFGLARRGEGSDLTRTHAVMGTPAYMAPEQTRGGGKFAGPPADVWALGVMLYECVAGARPFDGDTAEILLARISSAEPPALSARARSVPRDLDTIVSKCLAKEPEHRYPTATELADDLGRFVRGEPITARPVGSIERVVRWARRKPTAAAAYGFSSLAVILAAVVFVVLGLWRDAEGAKKDAEAARDQLVGEKKLTEAARDDALRQRNLAETARLGEADARGKLAAVEYGRTVQLAHQEWQENNVRGAIALLNTTEPARRGWEWHYVHRLCHSNLLTLKGHKERVTSAVWSPDGKRIATNAINDPDVRVWDAKTGDILLTLRTGGDHLVSWGPVGTRVLTVGRGPVGAPTARVWDAETGKEVGAFRGPDREVVSAAFSPDGSKVATAGRKEDPTVRLWEVRTRKELRVLKGLTGDILVISWSPDGSKIAAAGNDRIAQVWDANTGNALFALTHTGVARLVSWSPDGRRLVTEGPDATAVLWDAGTGTRVHALKGYLRGDHYYGMGAPTPFSPDGSKVVTVGGANDGTVRLWDVKTGAELLALRWPPGVTSAAWSADGSRVLAVGIEGVVRVWDTKTGVEVLPLRGASAAISAEFSPDGSRIVTGNVNGAASVWDARAKPDAKTVVLNNGRTHPCDVSWSPDGEQIWTGELSGRVRRWDARTGTERVSHTLRRPADSINCLVWSPDGNRVLTGLLDGTARVWDSQTGNELVALRGHTNWVYAAAWSPDGSRVLTGSTDGTARVWDAVTGQALLTLPQGDSCYTVAWSRAGSRLATGTGKGVVRVWDAHTGREVMTLECVRDRDHAHAVADVSFSPDGSKLAASSYDPVAPSNLDRVIQVWEVGTGAQLLTIWGNPGAIPPGGWSPDGSRLVTTKGHTARVWDTNSGAEVLTLRGHVGLVGGAAWSPDGSRIVTAGFDGTAKVWDARPLNRDFVPKELAPLPRHVGK